jgi:hypothetical protein
MGKALAVKPSRKSNSKLLLLSIAALASTGKSASAECDCEPVKVVDIGYVKGTDGQLIIQPGTNLTQYKITVKKCPSSESEWSFRTYYGYADSISFNKHKFWCVKFLNGGADYRFIRNAKRADCK